MARTGDVQRLGTAPRRTGHLWSHPTGLLRRARSKPHPYPRRERRPRSSALPCVDGDRQPMTREGGRAPAELRLLERAHLARLAGARVRGAEP
jgi:hypothetical protein